MSFAEDPARFIASSASVSDKIRALDAAGYSRADIARMLHKRYQHVRNVLEADRAKREGAKSASPLPETAGAREDRARPERLSAGDVYRLKFTDDGCIVVPQRLQDALGLRRGGVAIAELDGDRLIVLSSSAALKKAQDLVRSLQIPDGVSMADELIAERRREAAREEQDG